MARSEGGEYAEGTRRLVLGGVADHAGNYVTRIRNSSGATVILERKKRRHRLLDAAVSLFSNAPAYSSLIVNATGSGSAVGANGSYVVSPVSMTGSIIGSASDSTSTSW